MCSPVDHNVRTGHKTWGVLPSSSPFFFLISRYAFPVWYLLPQLARDSVILLGTLSAGIPLLLLFPDRRDGRPASGGSGCGLSRGSWPMYSRLYERAAEIFIWIVAGDVEGCTASTEFSWRFSRSSTAPHERINC